jgi:hypothetical protein
MSTAKNVRSNSVQLRVRNVRSPGESYPRHLHNVCCSCAVARSCAATRVADSHMLWRGRVRTFDDVSFACGSVRLRRVVTHMRNGGVVASRGRRCVRAVPPSEFRSASDHARRRSSRTRARNAAVRSFSPLRECQPRGRCTGSVAPTSTRSSSPRARTQRIGATTEDRFFLRTRPHQRGRVPAMEATRDGERERSSSPPAQTGDPAERSNRALRHRERPRPRRHEPRSARQGTLTRPDRGSTIDP